MLPSPDLTARTMSESADNDLDLVAKMARDAIASGTALTGSARTSKASNLERTISVLAKQLSKKATEGVEDRRMRQIARTETYNAVRPVLEAFADHHKRLSIRTSWLLAVSMVTFAAAVAYYALR
jgi:hypothetical protein